MEKIKTQFTLQNFVQFIKLQLAGNILFWGTLIGSFLLHDLLKWSALSALLTASIVSHILFFLADREWVFNDGRKPKKSSNEVTRFILFMGLNFFINLGIVTGVTYALAHYEVHFAFLADLNRHIDVNLYLAQFAAALFFTFWTFIGLKYWVFRRVPVPVIYKGVRRGSRKSSK